MSGDGVLALLPVAGWPAPGDPWWAGALPPAELGYARGRQRAAEHLAARVAARHALTALVGADRVVGAAVHRTAAGAPRLQLPGAGPAPGVSLSHAAGWAAALVWTVEP